LVNIPAPWSIWDLKKHVYQCCLCEHRLETHPISLAEIERFIFASRAFARQPWMHWQNPMFVAFAKMNKYLDG